MGIEDLVAARIAEFGAQAFQFLPVEHCASHIGKPKPYHVICVMSFGLR